MIKHLPIQEIDLWEAWIEYDQLNPTHFGTLYIFGEIPVGNTAGETVIKRSHCEGKNLILQLPARTSGRTRTREVWYSEPIKDLNQYDSVSIYAGTKLIATLDDIEVLI